MTVEKYRPGRPGAQSPSKISIKSTDSDDTGLFDIPDSSPNSPIERPHDSETVNSKNPFPDSSGFHLNLAEANQDIFTIPDSQSPSPVYIDSEDMFNISDSPLVCCPSPAPSGLDSNLVAANRGIFTISDSRSLYRHGGYVLNIRLSTTVFLSCSL
jgi:hypothetical protein